MLGGGDDDVSGDEGVDVVMGNGGHDVVCGDAADPLVTGGGGSDVPCPVVEGTFDATSGSVTIDLGNGVRELDDEFLEVEGGRHRQPVGARDPHRPDQGHPHARGHIVTYIVNAGATGSDFYEYALRRKVVACPGDITVTFQGEEQTVDLCDGQPRAGAVITREWHRLRAVGVEADHAHAADSPPPPAAGRAPGRRSGRSAAALPVTGGDDLGLALAGLGLVALGAVVTAESRRRPTNSK